MYEQVRSDGERRKPKKYQTGVRRSSKVFRTPVAKARLLSMWESEKVGLARPVERQAWLDKHGCPWHTFRNWLRSKDKLLAASKTSSKLSRMVHTKQKRGIFYKQQEELVRRIMAKRARGLPVSGTWCRVTMRKLVGELGDVPGAKRFKASSQWFHGFRRRWGFTFQEKTNVKKKSVSERLPYVRKYHQYVLYTAFREEP